MRPDPNFIAGCLLIMVACTSRSTAPPQPDPAQLVPQGVFVSSWRLVLDADRRRYALADCRLPGDLHPWVPESAALDRSDNLLADVLRNRLAGIHTSPMGRLVPADYFRFYVPVVVEDRELLCIRGVHRHPLSNIDIEAYAALVDDGGAGIFSAVYDVATDEITSFSFAGQ